MPEVLALADVQQSFADALPRIEGLARAYLGFKHRGDEDAVAEVLALSWKAYQELAMRGRDVVKLLGRMVEFSARRVRSGRRLVWSHPARDVLSTFGSIRHGFQVASIPLSANEDTAPEIFDALRDGSSPADEAAFRIDLEAWLDGLDDRRWRVANQLAAGLNTVDVARLHGVTRARISQLREDLMREWERFNGAAGREGIPYRGKE